jgi:hypothetical protein
MPGVLWNPVNGAGMPLIASRVLIPHRVILCGVPVPHPPALRHQPAKLQNAEAPSLIHRRRFHECGSRISGRDRLRAGVVRRFAWPFHFLVPWSCPAGVDGQVACAARGWPRRTGLARRRPWASLGVGAGGAAVRRRRLGRVGVVPFLHRFTGVLCLPNSRESPADEPPGGQLSDHGNGGDG